MQSSRRVTGLSGVICKPAESMSILSFAFVVEGPVLP